MNTLLPVFYTEREGGEWLRWDSGPVHEDQLYDLGYHSFAFDDPAKGCGNFPRWDVLSAWTTPL